MAELIGVALVGAGWAGNRHAIAYRALPDRGRIVAVVDARRAIAEARAGEWAVPFASDDLAAALARPNVQAVDICLPHTLHAAAAEAALAAGKHVLIEKPFATSIDEADAMIAAAARARRILMVAENVRYDPVYLRMTALIFSRAIGAPFLCRISRDHHMHASLRAAMVLHRPDRRDHGERRHPRHRDRADADGRRAVSGGLRHRRPQDAH